MIKIKKIDRIAKIFYPEIGRSKKWCFGSYTRKEDGYCNRNIEYYSKSDKNRRNSCLLCKLLCLSIYNYKYKDKEKEIQKLKIRLFNNENIRQD